MKTKFNKTKTEHHILKEFYKFLQKIEELEEIKRIIPGRIKREQKTSSQQLFKISYTTNSGLKGIISKGSTAQEIFIICDESKKEILKTKLIKIWNELNKLNELKT